MSDKLLGAQAVVWRVANSAGIVPIDGVLNAYPEPAQTWVRDWLATPAQWCGHVGLLLAPFGSRLRLCVPCAISAEIDSYLLRCGRCGSVVDHDGMSGTIALGETVLVYASICAPCWNEGGGS